MKTSQCLLVMSVALCTVTSFKIFPITNRRLSVSWNVEPTVETTPFTDSDSIVSTTPSEFTEKFTNLPESLLIVSEVTASEEIDTTETSTTLELNKDSEITASKTVTEISAQSEEASTTEVPAVKYVSSNTIEIEQNYETKSSASFTSSEGLETITSEADTGTVSVAEKNEMNTVSSALPSLLETSSPKPQPPVDLLPPKTEYKKYDFDPRYDDWNTVPLDYDGI